MEMDSYQSIENMHFGAGGGSDTPERKQPSPGNDRKKLFFLVAAALLLFLVAVIAIKVVSSLKKEDQEEEVYTVAGEWSSRDMLNLEEIFMEMLVYEAGLDANTASLVAGLLGLEDGESVVSFWFTDSGVVHMSVEGLAVGADHLTYEILDDDTMLLRFEWSVTVFGTTIPINISYLSDFTVDKNRLTLDLFGYKTNFDRVQ